MIRQPAGVFPQPTEATVAGSVGFRPGFGGITIVEREGDRAATLASLPVNVMPVMSKVKVSTLSRNPGSSNWSQGSCLMEIIRRKEREETVSSWAVTQVSASPHTGHRSVSRPAAGQEPADRTAAAPQSGPRRAELISVRCGNGHSLRGPGLRSVLVWRCRSHHHCQRRTWDSIDVLQKSA